MTLDRNSKVFIPTLTAVIAALVALSPFAIDTYIAALPVMAKSLGVELHVAELTITLYFLGFALGNFFGGPLSDAFGRKTIALIGIAMYGLAAMLIPISPNIELILLLRLIQAFGGGFATVTGNVFVRDWYSGKKVARFITIISMIIMLAPLFAPVIGAGLISLFGWKSIFIFHLVFASVLWISMYLLIPESRDKTLITKRITIGELLGKYSDFFSNRYPVLMLFAISLPMAGLYIFIQSASFIYIEYFGVTQLQFPIFFGANIILNILLSLLNTFLLKKYKPAQILRVGLFMQLLAGIALAVVVRMQEPTLMAVFIPIVFFIGSLGLVFGNGSATILNHNPELAGSANATIGIARFALSFLIGSIMTLFRTGDLIPFGTVLLLCSLSGNLLLIWAFKAGKEHHS